MSERALVKEVTQSMRGEHSRWEVPDHGWLVDLYCRRDDGLEVMQDRVGFLERTHLRIQGLGDPSYHYSQSMKLEPVRVAVGGWFSASGALHREMKRLHEEKRQRLAQAGLRALCGGST